MRRIILIFLFLSLMISSVFPTTESDKSYLINIDGKSGDYDRATESLLRNTDYPKESEFDSFWGDENEVIDIKCTWDSGFLYVFIEGVINGNNLMVFLDSTSGGIPDFKPEDSSESISWNRTLTFASHYPDFYLGTWPDNSTPENYRAISAIRDERFYNYSGFESASYFPTGIRGGIEFKISWEELFGTTSGTVPSDATVRISACITGSWGGSSPDVIPDNSAGASTDGQQRIILDNFAVVHVDMDKDGYPDIGVDPVTRTTFPIPDLPHKPTPIDISELKVFPKLISTVHNQQAEISFYLNISKNITIKVFNLKGDRVRTIIYNQTAVIGENNTGTNPGLVWDGKDDFGNVVPEGVYIISVKDEDETFRKLVSVAVVH